MNKSLIQMTIDNIDGEIEELKNWCKENHHNVEARLVRHTQITSLRTKKALLKNKLK